MSLLLKHLLLFLNLVFVFSLFYSIVDLLATRVVAREGVYYCGQEIIR